MLFLMTVGTVSLAAFVQGAASQVGWSKNVKVNQGPSPFVNQFTPALAVDPQGRIFAGWDERGSNNSALMEPVAFSRSLDGGQTWAPTTFMDFLRVGGSYKQALPKFALDGQGRLYYERLEFNSGLFSPQGVIVSRTGDRGSTWGPVANAQDDVHDFNEVENIASDGAGNLYVAYPTLVQGGALTFHLRMTRSTDGGMTWSPSVVLSDNSNTFNIAPVIDARPRGRVNVAWVDSQVPPLNILFDTSADFGQTWGADVRVNDVPGTVFGVMSMARDSRGTLFVAWSDTRNGDPDILVSKSDDGGRTWLPPVKVNDVAQGIQWSPSLAVDGNDNLHLAWLDSRTGSWNVFYSTSKDGRRWSPNERVTDAETLFNRAAFSDYQLALAVDGQGTIYTVWSDGRGGDLDIFFARKPALTTAAVLSSLVPGPTLAASAVPASRQ